MSQLECLIRQRAEAEAQRLADIEARRQADAANTRAALVEQGFWAAIEPLATPRETLREYKLVYEFMFAVRGRRYGACLKLNISGQGGDLNIAKYNAGGKMASYEKVWFRLNVPIETALEPLVKLLADD